jgi:hypothetical protein
MKEKTERSVSDSRVERTKQVERTAVLVLDGVGARVGDDRFAGVARAGLTATGGGNGEVGLVFPLPGPGLPGPALQRDGANRRPVLVANDLTPGTGVCGTDLGGAFTHAEKAFASRGQASNGSPILGAG